VRFIKHVSVGNSEMIVDVALKLRWVRWAGASREWREGRRNLLWKKHLKEEGGEIRVTIFKVGLQDT
jgi:hypothetical protein